MQQTFNSLRHSYLSPRTSSVKHSLYKRCLQLCIFIGNSYMIYKYFRKTVFGDTKPGVAAFAVSGNCSYFVVMYTLQTILQKLRQHQPELQRKYPVSRIGIFGSYARGEATADSDIDLAVEFSAPMGLNFVEMADEIENLFGIKTDVVPKRSIKPDYLPYVEKDIVYVW
ncbi:MAG: nucleotidyltransferase family protein [Bacteroidota bacterium]